MKCRYPGCPNIPTRWSRLSYCGEHRGAARSLCVQLKKPSPELPPLSDKLRRFNMLKAHVEASFPSARRPFARSKAGYEVMVLAPGGLRA